MMMSKPNDESNSATEDNGGNERQLVPPTPLQTETATNSVKDLERRLQMMSQAESKPAAAAATAPSKPAAAAPAAAATGGGKNALLVSNFFSARLLRAIVSRNPPCFCEQVLDIVNALSHGRPFSVFIYSLNTLLYG